MPLTPGSVRCERVGDHPGMPDSSWRATLSAPTQKRQNPCSAGPSDLTPHSLRRTLISLLLAAGTIPPTSCAKSGTATRRSPSASTRRWCLEGMESRSGCALSYAEALGLPILDLVPVHR